MVQIAVCDDDLVELSNTIQLINQYRASKHLNCEYAVFQNGFELISALKKGKRFNIFFLDIIMPAFSGIAVAKEIRCLDRNASIVFFTTTPEFAFESYSVKAINYVLKPITKEKLFRTLDDVLERIKIEEEDAFIIKNAEGIKKIPISNLAFSEASGKNVLYHLSSGKVIECIDSFNSVCDNLLKYQRFIKTHRSYIVNMQHINTIENRRVTLQNLSVVPIAQGNVRRIKQQYLAFQLREDEDDK